MTRADWIEAAKFDVITSVRVGRPKEADSPYFEHPLADFQTVTRDVMAVQPLDGPALVSGVMSAWSDIFESRIGIARIGVDLQPAPQIMGFLLHELIPIRLQALLPEWRRGQGPAEKDLVYEPDPSFSIEIKTSSDAKWVYGNRSYGIPSAAPTRKAKSGYYCAVNFEKWSPGRTPRVLRVRYG